MTVKLLANIEKQGDAGFVAWIDSIKGLVVQGNSIEEVCKELMISLKVKLAFDWGIPASDLKEISAREARELQRKFPSLKSNKPCKQEISLTIS